MTPGPVHLQERSRATAQRLVEATLTLLAEDGLEGAVIPRIAAAAGVAPASVYRRFTDKDGLLRAAFLHMLEATHAANQQRLAGQLLRADLAATLKRLVAVLVGQYRGHPRLVRALARYLESDPASGFAQRARAIMSTNVDVTAQAILGRHRAEIRNPEPERALRFVVIDIAGAIESFELDPHSAWHLGAALSRAELARHLAASALAYLRTAGR